jgi:hypothetical protein
MVKKNFLIKGKHGWIKLVEVFIAILLLAGVLLIVANKSSSNKSDLQTQISEKETGILTDIELNNTLRAEILNVDSDNLPIEWNNFGSELEDLRERIIDLTPKNLDCKAKICLINEDCILNELPAGDVYSKSTIISADFDTYSPRELKLFCTSK